MTRKYNLRGNPRLAWQTRWSGSRSDGDGCENGAQKSHAQKEMKNPGIDWHTCRATKAICRQFSDWLNRSARNNHSRRTSPEQFVFMKTIFDCETEIGTREQDWPHNGASKNGEVDVWRI